MSALVVLSARGLCIVYLEGEGALQLMRLSAEVRYIVVLVVLNLEVRCTVALGLCFECFG